MPEESTLSKKPNDLDEQLSNGADDDEQDNSGLIKFMMVFGVIMIISSIAMIGYLGYRIMNEEESADQVYIGQEQENVFNNQPAIDDIDEEDDDEETEVENQEISCSPNCTLSDLFDALVAHKNITSYRMEIIAGYGCLDTIQMTVHEGDIRANISNEGGDFCYTPSGLEIRKVDGDYYSKLPGESWKVGLAKNENGYPYFDPDENLLSNAIPEQEFTSTLSQYSKIYEGNYEREVFYIDEIENKKGVIMFTGIAEYPENPYQYRVTRIEGIEDCITAPGSLVGVGECVSSLWYYNENLDLIAYSPPTSEDFGMRIFLDFDSNSVIEKPI